MSGCPGRPNLLLATLGPGLSACLLDLFMMSAGPCLRGKVAHGELDLSSIFTKPSPQTCSSSSLSSPFLSSSVAGFNEEDSCSGGGGGGGGGGGSDGGGDSLAAKAMPGIAGVVSLTAGVFFALCGRYDVRVGARAAHRGGGDTVNRNPEEVPRFGGGSGSSSPSVIFSSRGGDGGVDGSGGSIFVEALASCDSHCSEWTPRFHPHELLEEDLQNSWTEFGHLAAALERRAISVEALPGADLARMTVSISLCDDDDDTGDSNGDGDGGNSNSSVSQGERDYAVPATGKEPSESTRERMEEARQPSGGIDEGELSVVETKMEDRPFKGTPATEVVLTLTDTAHRLIPPPADAEDLRLLPVPTKDGCGSTKRRGSMATNATSGVFPGLLRVNNALRHHVASLGGYFRRTAHHGGQGGSGLRHSSGAPLDLRPSGGCRQPAPALGEGNLSAFTIYMHSERCRNATTCALDCPDRAPRHALGDALRSSSTGTSASTCAGTSTSGSTSTSSPLKFKAGSSAERLVDGATMSDKHRDRREPVPRTDEHGNGTDNSGGTNGVVTPDTGHPRDTRRNAHLGACREGEDDEDGNARPRPETYLSPDLAPTPAASATKAPAPAPTRALTPPPRTTRCFRRHRDPGRISPSTNVVTAVPLPQIACMSSLCRSCADVARGLRAHIGELEALLASGAARSGQRRAYAATLHVAPTLLRYLAAAAATVEAFVLDWHARHGGKALAADVAGSDGGSCPEPPSSPPPPAIVRGSANGATGLGSRRSHVSVPSTAAAASAGTTEARSAAASESTAAVGSTVVLASVAAATSTPPDIAASLGFLRRLAAVNGSLALCVAAGAGGVRSATAAAGKEVGSVGVGGAGEGAGSATTRVEKSGGGGRKGYAQALAELVSFLESKAARRGFAGL